MVSKLKTAVVFWIIVIWSLSLWGVLIGKLCFSGGEFFEMLTNWNWLLNALFFGADLVIELVLMARRDGRISTSDPADVSKARGWLIWLFFWVVHGCSWLVFWLVIEVLVENPRLLIDGAREAGVGLGIALLVDRWEHVLPAVMITFYIYFRWSDFVATMLAFHRPPPPPELAAPPPWFVYAPAPGQPRPQPEYEHDELNRCSCVNRTSRLLLYVMLVTLSPVVLLTLYMLLFDMRRIYGLYHAPVIATAGLALLTLIIFNVLPFTLVFDEIEELYYLSGGAPESSSTTAGGASNKRD